MTRLMFDERAGDRQGAETKASEWEMHDGTPSPFRNFLFQVKNFFTGKMFSRKRDERMQPYGNALAVKKREELRAALVEIREAGFYTFEGLASLMLDHHRRKGRETSKALQDHGLGHDQRAKLHGELEYHKYAIRSLRPGAFEGKVSDDLKRLCELKETSRYLTVPRGERLRVVHDFFEQTGLLRNPIPVNWFVEKPDVARGIVYRAAGGGDILYHSLRMATGLNDPAKDFPEPERRTPKPFAGAVYRSFIYDNPYFKRGAFVVRNGDRRGPVEVEYFEGWESDLPAGDSRVKQRYEDYYRGYLLDQGYDSYVFLFGPQPASMPFDELDNLSPAFGALKHLMDTRRQAWEKSERNIATFLRSLGEDDVVASLKEYVQADTKPPVDGITAKAGSDFKAKGTSLAVFDGPDKLSSVFADTRLGHSQSTALREFDAQAKDAHQLKDTLWKLFEVNGKPAPKVGNHLRVRTLYLEGANRADLTPNALRGRVLSFDNMSKSEMLSERTIMYRLFQPTTSPVEILSHAARARKLCGRFDMRVDDETRGRLAGFEPEYRQIFLDLGYDVAPVEEDHKAFRINPVVTDTGSDIEETEFIIE